MHASNCTACIRQYQNEDVLVIEDLKRNQYASHCQMCLCDRSPQELVPRGSYIEWEEVRRRVVEAYHVDPKSAGGARHAGNLILLCKLHHDNFGQRLTRAVITSALCANSREELVRFDADLEVKDQLISFQIPDTGEVVDLFFSHHRASFGWNARWSRRTETGEPVFDFGFLCAAIMCGSKLSSDPPLTARASAPFPYARCLPPNEVQYCRCRVAHRD